MVPRLGRDLADGPVTVVAYVDRYPPFVNAGAEWMLHAMLADSAARGHAVTVVTPCAKRPTVLDGVTVVPEADLDAVAGDAEVLVGHLLYTRQVVDLARARQLPLLYLVHNDDQLRYWRLRADDVTALVWNSEWIAAAGRANRDVGHVPATVVRPPLGCGPYSPEAPAPAEREFVTLVNPIAAKGAAVFYALARRDRQRRFLAVEGAYGSQQRPGRDDTNVAWQRQTPAIGPDVLARTRVLLVPSRYESWGRAAAEALCSGIPVIAGDTPGLRECLGAAGRFLDPDDHRAWRAALAELDAPDAYAAASAAALARAGELEAMARLDLERWDRLVRLAAGGHRVRSGRMTTTPYDPFRGGARAGTVTGDGSGHALPPIDPDPEAPARTDGPAEAPPAPLAAIPPDGGPEGPAGPEGGEEAPIRAPWDVPEKAVDIVHALKSERDPATARWMAESVATAEATRDQPRKSVTAAAASILGT